MKFDIGTNEIRQDKQNMRIIVTLETIRFVLKGSQSRFYNSRVYLNSFCLGKLDSRTRTSLPKIKII